MSAIPLRGRDVQLETLRSCLVSLASGRGGVVLLAGLPGVGKSRLLAAAMDLADEQGMRVFHARADVADQVVPLRPLLGALVVSECSQVDTTSLRELTRSPDQRFWLLQELQEGLERSALNAPIVIALDDLQWADPATLSAVVTLSRGLASYPVLWLLVFRSGDPNAAARDGARQLEAAGAIRVTLNRLDDAAVLQVFLDAIGASPDVELVDVLGRLHGQPFLLSELLRGLKEEQLLEITDGTARLVGSHLPARLVDSVGEQLAQLTQPARDLLHMAAVLGRRFTASELAELLDRPARTLIAPLREVLDASLLVEDGDRLAFRHDLVREAVEARLPETIRRGVRQEAADVMLRHGAPPAEIAALIAEVARPGDNEAVQLLVRAATEVGHDSPSVALPLSLQALELTPRGAVERSERILLVLDLMSRSGQAAAAHRLLTEVSVELTDPQAEAIVRLKIGILLLQYSPGRVADQCRQGLQLTGLPVWLRIQLLSLHACALEMSGEIDQAGDPAGQARAQPQPPDGKRTGFALIPDALLSYAHGDARRAVQLARQAVATHPGTVDDELRLWWPDTWLALVLLASGESDEAMVVIDAGFRRARDEGVTAMLRVWTMLRCRVLFDTARLNDAWAEAEAIIEMSDEAGAAAGGYLNAIANFLLGRIALHTARPEQLATAQRAATALARAESRCGRAMGSWLAAQLAVQERGAAVLARFDPAELDPLAAGYIHATAPRSYADTVTLVRQLVEAERSADAARVVARLVDAAARHPEFPFLIASATHARGVLGGDPELVLTALELHRGDLRPLVCAAVLTDAGRLLPETRRAEAVTHLDIALGIYQRAGADRDAAGVRKLLRARGIRRAGRAAVSDSRWPELTDSELAVTRLAAGGATNREIAEQQFISPYTVNSHLRHIFGKLGIRSRVELARLVARRERGDAIE